MNDDGRDYYEDGTLRCIRPLRDGVPHGLHREWHQNGVLKEETPWNNGVIDGTVRYWNDKGELLGASELKNGTGILHYWIPEQQMHGERSYVDGKWTGRWVGYLGGELSRVNYWLENKRVSRKRYDIACKNNARLPRYGSDHELGPTWRQKAQAERRALGKVKGNADGVKRKARDTVAQKVLARKDVVEALDWLKGICQSPRWLGEATDQDDSINFVKRLYRLGAVKVHAAKIDGDPAVGYSAGLLVVELPVEKPARRKLLRVCGKVSEKLGFSPSADTGQRYQVMMLD